MKFKKEYLVDGIDGDGPCGKTVHTKHTGSRRWSQSYARVFEIDGKFYSTRYRVGSTEMQDESPYEYEGDEIECTEVFPRQKTVTEYVIAEELAK